MDLSIFKDKKILVTGHTGFKGSWLCAWLKLLGADVVGVSLEPNTNPNHFELLNLAMDSRVVDIRDSKAIERTFLEVLPDFIFHLAAQPLVRDSYETPLYTMETNIMGTANVLNACRTLKDLKGVLIVTTDKCYENKEWVWGYRENDPMGGYDPYSASKGCAELVTACFRNSYFNLDEFGLSHHTLVASARGGNVIGGGDWAKDRLIPDIVRATIRGETVEIRSPNATRPWQHVLECLSGYLCLAQKLLEGDKAFAQGWNFAQSHEGHATVLDVLKRMQYVWPDVKYQINIPKNPPHEAMLLKLDCTKANTLLNWRNFWGLDKTIESTTKWYRRYYETGEILTFSDIEAYMNDIEGYYHG